MMCHYLHSWFQISSNFLKRDCILDHPGLAKLIETNVYLKQKITQFKLKRTKNGKTTYLFKYLKQPFVLCQTQLFLMNK